MVCCHRDGDPSDNRVECLRWDTYRANSDDMRLHQTRLRGVVTNAKLTEDEVQRIRRLGAEGIKFADLAETFGGCRQNIVAIVSRR